MSRSYKKPYFTDQQQSRRGSSGPSTSVYQKRKASKAVRRANKYATKENEEKELKNGKSYRKAFCSWNIRDFSFYSKDKKAKRK